MKVKGLIIDIAGVLVLFSIISVFSVVPVEAQSISYHRVVFKVYGESFYINITYVSRILTPGLIGIILFHMLLNHIIRPILMSVAL